MKMNLQNKKVKYFLNILLILTVLFSFITTILIITLLNDDVQPEVIIILVASSILLLFNLVLSRFIKNKVLLLIINLVLSLTLIGSSITLIVNLQKFKTIEGFQTVSEAEVAVQEAQVAVDKAKFNVGYYQDALDNGSFIGYIKDYIENDKNIVDNADRPFYKVDYMNVNKLTTKIAKYESLFQNLTQVNKKTDQGADLNDYITLLKNQKISVSMLEQAKTDLVNTEIALENAEIALENINNPKLLPPVVPPVVPPVDLPVDPIVDPQVIPQINLKLYENTKLKALESVSYTTAVVSIVSGISIALTNLLMFKW